MGVIDEPWVPSSHWRDKCARYSQTIGLFFSNSSFGEKLFAPTRTSEGAILPIEGHEKILGQIIQRSKVVFSVVHSNY